MLALLPWGMAKPVQDEAIRVRFQSAENEDKVLKSLPQVTTIKFGVSPQTVDST